LSFIITHQGEENIGEQSIEQVIEISWRNYPLDYFLLNNEKFATKFNYIKENNNCQTKPFLDHVEQSKD
jgi:hypothetical protein